MLLQKHKAINQIQSRNDAVITTVHKSIAVLILDVNQCKKEAEQQLHDTERYNMSHDNTTANNKIFNKVISRFNKEDLMTKKRTKGLKNENPLP